MTASASGSVYVSYAWKTADAPAMVDLLHEVLIDPGGPESGERRVARGGSWIDFARYCRSALRDHGGPGSRDVNLGFRLARGPIGGRPGSHGPRGKPFSARCAQTLVEIHESYTIRVSV